ncbi:MAG TPA: RES family NAD+ phosphorylase [Lichenihabitans sp.]|jgi:RES domain-containing protein|nr:RES family NAD+ phosphorylase [Lichenihabitans sp.]
MSQIVWRIAADTATYQADDLSGGGAKATGGRWNEKDYAVLYTSTTRALACLETLVHLNASGLPLNRYLVEFTIPDPVWAAAQRESQESLPVGWDAEPASVTGIQFGTDWIINSSSALLVLPSVVVPEEFNVLINPAHSDVGRITCRKVRKWLYDPRLHRP